MWQCKEKRIAQDLDDRKLEKFGQSQNDVKDIWLLQGKQGRKKKCMMNKQALDIS